MGQPPYRLLRISRIVLLVIAYVQGVSIFLFAGLLPLIVGGEPVPLLLGEGPLVPMRLMGFLNMVITAPLIFIFLYTPSGIIHLLLDLRQGSRAAGSGAA